MPEQYNNADALGLFLTGAASDGGNQPDADLSFGNYRSSTREELTGFFISRSIPGIIIERIGGANGTGTGSLEAIGGGSLRWTAPGDSPGEIVEIAEGETKQLTSADLNKFIVVSRQTADELAGAATVRLMPVFNNAIGSSNVPDGEAEVKLRCIAIKNLHASDMITNLKAWIGTLGTQQVSDAGQLGASGAGTIETTGTFSDWPDTGFCRITTAGGSLREIVYYSERTETVLTVPAAGRELLGTTAAAGAADDKLYAVPGVKIAKEAPSGGHFTVASDEHDTASVSGLSWSTGITAAGGLDMGTLLAGGMVGIWIWLEVIEGRTAAPLLKNILCLQGQSGDIAITTATGAAAEAGFTISPAATAEIDDITAAAAEADFIIAPACTAEVLDSVEVEAAAGFTIAPAAAADIDEITAAEAEAGITVTPGGEGTSLENKDEGLYRIADDTLERYELFRGIDEEPDLEDEPYETFTELPHITAGVPDAELFFVLRRRNKFNLTSLNVKSWSVKTDADGQVILPTPDAPQNTGIVPAAGATGYVTSQYFFEDEDEYPATHWLIYFTDDGGDPDPELDEPTVVEMSRANGQALLRWTSPAADNLDTLKMLVRTRTVSGEDSADSDNTDIYSCTASDQGPAAPAGRAFLGLAAEDL